MCIAVFVCTTPCCVYCLVRACVTYRRKNTRIAYRVVTQAPQVIHMSAPTTATTTSINNTMYDEQPPAYVPNSDYQPCAAGAPPPAAKDPDQ